VRLIRVRDPDFRLKPLSACRLCRTAIGFGPRMARAALIDARGEGIGRDGNKFNPFRLYWVNPQAVARTMASRFSDEARGSTIGGDWDLRAIPIDQTVVHRGLTQRFMEGRDWIDTDLHPDRYVPDCANDQQRYLHLSLDEFLDRGARLDALFQKLLRYGYRSHLRLGRPFDREMAVNVGRDGSLIRNSSGLHRLVLSQIIGLPAVPVRFLVAHTAGVITVQPITVVGPPSVHPESVHSEETRTQSRQSTPMPIPLSPSYSR
jgi:hypothetical protein